MNTFYLTKNYLARTILPKYAINCVSHNAANNQL